MTDLDVVERVAFAFGTKVQSHRKGRNKTEFAATARGSTAAQLMTQVRPMMSGRRQSAIDRALRSYSPVEHKLSFPAAEEIRRRHRNGESVSALAREFGVARQTIHPILDGRIYREPREWPWRDLSERLGDVNGETTALDQAELYWLAGWLEGEGSFLKPPPSSPRAARISASCCDEDVIREVARILGVAPGGERSPRNARWAPIWRVLLTGGRAVSIMRAVEPVMGARRQRQIREAIEAAASAGATFA
jgi:hypothetical protein